MSVQIIPEQQIQRINVLLNQLKKIEQISESKLNTKPNSKKWSVLEVIKHMILAHQAYQSKISHQLTLSGSFNINNGLEASWLPSYLISKFPPKEQKVQMKMKTTSKFEPQLSSTDSKESIIKEMEIVLNELKSWIETYRTQNITLKKFNSAIGAIVRFNIPEACEFILAHNERHFFQIEKILSWA